MSSELFGGLVGKQKRPHFAPDFRLEEVNAGLVRYAELAVSIPRSLRDI